MLEYCTATTGKSSGKKYYTRHGGQPARSPLPTTAYYKHRKTGVSLPVHQLVHQPAHCIVTDSGQGSGLAGGQPARSPLPTTAYYKHCKTGVSLPSTSLSTSPPTIDRSEKLGHCLRAVGHHQRRRYFGGIQRENNFLR